MVTIKMIKILKHIYVNVKHCLSVLRIKRGYLKYTVYEIYFYKLTDTLT